MSLKDYVIVMLAIVAVSLFFFGQKSIDAVSGSMPLCIFTVLGGAITMYAGSNPLQKLVGAVLITSPFWLLPSFDMIAAAIAGAV